MVFPFGRADEDPVFRKLHLHTAADIELLQIFTRYLKPTCRIHHGQFHKMMLIAIHFLNTQRFTR